MIPQTKYHLNVKQNESNGDYPMNIAVNMSKVISSDL